MCVQANAGVPLDRLSGFVTILFKQFAEFFKVSSRWDDCQIVSKLGSMFANEALPNASFHEILTQVASRDPSVAMRMVDDADAHLRPALAELAISAAVAPSATWWKAPFSVPQHPITLVMALLWGRLGSSKYQLSPAALATLTAAFGSSLVPIGCQQTLRLLADLPFLNRS